MAGGGGGQTTAISQDGNSSGTNTHGGRKSNWEVIEHYRNSGEPASLMATTSHSGVGRIDSYRGDSSFAQNSHTTGDGYDMDTHDTESTDESILKDHSGDWWNLLALCGRVFRYVLSINILISRLNLVFQSFLKGIFLHRNFLLLLSLPTQKIFLAAQPLQKLSVLEKIKDRKTPFLLAL